MFQYYKADTSTYVIRSVGGQIKRSGKGLSFFHSTRRSSIAAVPINAQDAPFIFKLQTGDFQEVTVQGQITYQIAEPLKAAEMLNFTVATTGKHRGYVCEDPLRLQERVVRAAQALVQERIEGTPLRDVLTMTNALTGAIRGGLDGHAAISTLGIVIVDVTLLNIAPTPETARALEAHTREAILQDADDAMYLRRNSAVEQERTIQEAELDTDRSVQEKQQQIEAAKVENEREIFRSQLQTDRERLQGEIEAEEERRSLVETQVANRNREAEAEAFAIQAKMEAMQTLPVEHMKALAQARMTPEQLVALALESFAQNAAKIGELNIAPELLHGLKSAVARS